MTEVVNVTKQNYDVKICRGTIFGNPFIMGRDGNREDVVRKYEEWFSFLLRDERFRAALLELQNKRLGCFCAPQKCHGDIIARYLNNL